MSIITFTSDFGMNDVYVAQVKGVIYSINPKAIIVDVTHNIPAYDIMLGAFTISSLYKYFPDGTVHLVVIDPGVGTDRNILIIRADEQYFVGPDNGVFSLLVQRMQKEHLEADFYTLNASSYYREDFGNTFEARDKMAPVVARLSLGMDYRCLGEKISAIKKLKFPLPSVKSNSVKGSIIYIDNFGNLITNVYIEDIKKDIAHSGIKLNDLTVKLASNVVISGLVESYGHVDRGNPCAIINSSGYIEIGINMGNAAQAMGAKLGDVVLIEFREGK